jgi:hypothetical protein
VRTSSRLTASLLIGCIVLAPLLSGCNQLRREMGDASSDGVQEGVQAAIPGSAVTVRERLNGFSSQLDILVVVGDASAVTADDVRAAAAAVCDAGPVGFDTISLSAQSGAAGSSERRYADVDVLMAEAFPDADLDAHPAIDALCAAAT